MQDTKTDNQYPSLNFEDLELLLNSPMLLSRSNETVWLTMSMNVTRLKSLLLRIGITDIQGQRVR